MALPCSMHLQTLVMEPLMPSSVLQMSNKCLIERQGYLVLTLWLSGVTDLASNLGSAFYYECVLGKWFNLSEPQFPLCENNRGSLYFSQRVLWGWNEIMCVLTVPDQHTLKGSLSHYWPLDQQSWSSSFSPRTMTQCNHNPPDLCLLSS
jgi:hypothetical protein